MLVVKEIEKIYDSKIVEDKWYAKWLKSGYFKADKKSGKEPFVIVIPPPNVTAALHMGHAYNNTIQDILIRWKRMQGFEALYQVGTDHAGIATQAVVERDLAKEGLTRKDLGREKFIERVWDWRGIYGGKIIEQLKKLGISADWDRERFTLDDGLSEAVQEVFIDLYNKGLIYKGNRIVNWDPASGTALADDEVDHKDVEGKLYHLKYKFKDSDEFLIVATTRPETLFGDTGVAISPDDKAKKHLIGKKVIIPFVNREVEIFADEHVDKDFGSGFVKTTPAHDPNDFEMGQRHNLPQVLMMDRDGKVLPICQTVTGADHSDELPIPAEFAGIDRAEARKLVIQRMDEMGQLDRIEAHPHSVGHSYRSGVAIEPYLSEQWFVKMQPLAEKALKVVQDGEIKFYPEGRYDKMYEHWLTNIRDWCISRQLWWGHRIPAWYNAAGEMKVCKDDPSTENEKWTQDEDVLDTWFSSWLWPFSTMGWPERTEDLAHFYPSSVLVTASDIIFFWVARMIMAGYEFLDQRPFHTVYFNGIVRDSKGRKMSKSLGNGIDPLEVIETYSTDAVRYTVVHLSSQGQDIKLAENDFEMGRNFSNKLWNSFRFLAMNLPEDYPSIEPYRNHFELADKWILSRLQETIDLVNTNMEKYRFSDAQKAIYEFYWNNFCDWYLELIKARLYKPENAEAKKTALAVASHVMKTSMMLLHPFMPFVTEEIWQSFRSKADKDSIMISDWPKVDASLRDDASEAHIAFVKDTIVKVRNIRAEMNVPVKAEIHLNVKSADKTLLSVLQNSVSYFGATCRTTSISAVENFSNELSAKFLNGVVEFQMPLADIIDVAAEKARIEAEINKKTKILNGTKGKLANDKFVNSAPAHIVEHERAKLAEIEVEIEKLNANLEALG